MALEQGRDDAMDVDGLTEVQAFLLQRWNTDSEEKKQEASQIGATFSSARSRWYWTTSSRESKLFRLKASLWKCYTETLGKLDTDDLEKDVEQLANDLLDKFEASPIASQDTLRLVNVDYEIKSSKLSHQFDLENFTRCVVDTVSLYYQDPTNYVGPTFALFSRVEWGRQKSCTSSGNSVKVCS
jgi:hypothetical protein